MQISKSRLWETIGQMMGILQQIARKKEMVWEFIVFKTLAKTTFVYAVFLHLCIFDINSFKTVKGWKISFSKC